MKVRCPYCQHVFVPGDKARCPGCGKVALQPGFFGKNERLKAGDIARRARQRDGSTRVGIRLPFGRPGRLLIAMAAMLVVGVLLLRRVNMGPPPSDVRRTYIARDNMAVLRAALDRFGTDCGRYPEVEEGLVALIHDPDAAGWGGPYILELKPDPWGCAFGYAFEQGRGRLHSAGPDGVEGTSDDISLAWDAGESAPRAEGLFPADIR